jgi:hypothetical protein
MPFIALFFLEHLWKDVAKQFLIFLPDNLDFSGFDLSRVSFRAVKFPSACGGEAGFASDCNA